MNEWDEKSDAMLRDLKAKGLSLSEILNALNNRFGNRFTRGSMEWRARSLGFTCTSPMYSVAPDNLAMKPKRPIPRAKSCQWPIGEPGDDDFHLCGGNVSGGKPYCEEHRQIAYVKKSQQD